MPLHSNGVGASTTITIPTDPRWIMSYSAATGVSGPEWFDTQAGLIMHPVFSVCPEWALMTSRPDPFGLGLTRDEVRRGLHASHEIEIHRPVRGGEVLTVTGTILGMRAIRSGSLVTIRLASTDADGEPVTTTVEEMLYLGVPFEGPDVLGPPVAQPATADGSTGPVTEVSWELGIGAAHVYTECARIWNPIHTDVVAATRAGLNGIILHGTATLATAVTALMQALGIDPSAVTRIACRFSGQVTTPCRLDAAATVTTRPSGECAVSFAVTIAGSPVLDRGLMVVRPT